MTGKVPSFSLGCTVSSALPGCVALCLILQVHRLVSAQFTVTGPDRPVIASLGGEAILPCHLSPRMSAENMEVRWFRSKYSEVVHLYHDGQDQYGEEMPEYRRRTALLKDDITNGRVFLRIRNVRPSDDGQYTCFFQSGVSYEEALLELQVAAAHVSMLPVSSPSQRLAKIRRRKKRTHDEMFSELMQSSHTERAQQNAWGQTMSECRKAQNEHEDRWWEQEERCRDQDNSCRQRDERRQEAMLRLLEDQTDTLRCIAEAQKRQLEHRQPRQPQCNQLPSSPSSIASSPRHQRTR